MIDFLFNYIVSIWFYENSSSLFTVICGVGFVSMTMMIYLLSREDSIKKIYFESFLCTIAGITVVTITLYGYISFPLAVLWTLYIKKDMVDSVREFYIRERNGDIEQAYHLIYDSSNKPVIYAWLLGVIILLTCIFILDGYSFLPVIWF